MTLYDDLHAGPATSTDGLASRIGRSLKGIVLSMQYSRMLQALCELSDENLAAIGIDRTDIPRHAHECVYGTDE